MSSLLPSSGALVEPTEVVGEIPSGIAGVPVGAGEGDGAVAGAHPIHATLRTRAEIKPAARLRALLTRLL
jgi:hypothetical protein